MPKAVAAEVAALAGTLDAALPPKQLDRNLVIGTWNIRAFGDLSDSWGGATDGGPQRDRRSLALITEIVSHFDVIAIQEVKGNIRCLRHMMHALGPNWSFILTDATRGNAGNDERLAFVFDTRRVRLSGLACELVLSDDDIKVAGAGDLVRQFARTPYAVSFASEGQTFILVTLHVLWGRVPGDRIPELRGIAEWVAGWADEIASWGQNLIALGDFNIDRKGDEAFEAFTSTGLHPADALNGVPRTIFAKGKGGFYDQIAWFDRPDGEPLLTLRPTGAAGGFDFVPHVYPELDKRAVSWRISDHFPLWCEFHLDPPVSPPG
ncbi:MAG: endonuclease/exonuclease/phosphatase family protein [Acidimicrobiales bacterium]